MKIDLSNKTALVTGGGRGIGASCAQFLADAGACVVVSARSTNEIEAVAAAIREAGGQAEAIACDVADESSVARLAEKAGPVDILVNNAGIADSAPLHRQTLERWNQILAVNATGIMLCCRAFVPGMAERGWGRVINIASIAGLSGARYIGAYSASKHAAVGFTRSLAAEVATKGVTVNAICPGYVDTAMTDFSVDRIQEKTGLDETTARAQLEKMSPQGRILEPEEVAFLTLMLCADLARGIHGKAIAIDGGSLLW